MTTLVDPKEDSNRKADAKELLLALELLANSPKGLKKQIVHEIDKDAALSELAWEAKAFGDNPTAESASRLLKKAGPICRSLAEAADWAGVKHAELLRRIELARVE
jgi:hypothetical protein